MLTCHHHITVVDLLPTTASTAAAANADEGDDGRTKDQYDMTRDTGGEITRAGGRRKISFLSFIKFIGTDYIPNRIGIPPPPTRRRTTTTPAAATDEEKDHDHTCRLQLTTPLTRTTAAVAATDEDDHSCSCQCCQREQPLVLESPVRSGFLPVLALTKTETGYNNFKYSK